MPTEPVNHPSTILLKGGRVIDPARGMDEVTDVLLMYGRIADLGPSIDRPVDRTIDATGLYVVPGLVDIHVHLREPGQEGKETIATGARAAAAGGFTTVCAMPNTNPPLDTRSGCEFVVDEGRRARAARVLPVGCVSKGRRGEQLAEMGDLVSGGACCFSDDGDPVKTPDLMRRAIAYAGMLDRVVVDHCEDLDLTSDGQMHEGAVSNVLGLPGKPGCGEDVTVARDILIAESLGARVHIQHISTARSVELVREAKRRGVRVTAEVCPHHLVLTDEACRDFDPSKHKMNPPLRAEVDRLACVEGLSDGTIEVIASDHAPHAREEKQREWSLAPNGVIGLESTLPIVLTELVEPGHVSLATAIRAMTSGAVAAMGLDHPSQVVVSSPGTLAPGGVADVTVIDPTTSYVLGADGYRSKSENSPFTGRTVRGRAMYTIVGGRIVHEAAAG